VIIVWGSGGRDQQAWQVIAIGLALTYSASLTPPDLGGSVYHVTAGHSAVVVAEAGAQSRHDVRAGYRAVLHADSGLS
jgi:hypothetical protein